MGDLDRLEPDELIRILKSAAKEFRARKKKNKAAVLEKLLQYLPDSPVLAVLEAEHLNLTTEFIEVLRTTFKVKKL